MIVRRPALQGTLDGLLAGLDGRAGRALVLRGEPGIGKTTVLADLADSAGDQATVLRATGVETEADLAFAALADVLGPIAAQRDVLPGPQAAALAAALALGPPAPGDRLAVCAATAGLLRAAAARRPVLVLVDDLQWVDAASRECLLFAARRAAPGVAVAFGLREPSALAPPGLPDVELRPFERAAALDLLRHHAPDLTPSAAVALADAAAGNPLALRELPSTLSAEQRCGAVALERPLEPGARLHAAFAGRVHELDPAARAALLVAAAHGAGDLPAIACACAARSTDAARLADAEARGLVHLSPGRVDFAHPLVRAAAYHDATPSARRAAHRALADAVGGERRVWHLAEAATGADEDVAAALEALGAGATARRGHASAAAALERAARLSPDPDSASRRLLAAGEAAGAAGVPDRALALLDEAAAHGDRRARALHARGRIMVWTGEPGDATELLVAEAERTAAWDPALAATMLADAANGCTATNAYHRAEALAGRAAALLRPDDPPGTRAPVLAMLGWALVLRGASSRARSVLADAGALAAGTDPLGPGWPWLHVLLRARVPLGDFAGVLRDGLALCDRAREGGALATLGGALPVTADAAFRLGDWDLTAAATREAARIAGETGQQSWHGYALTLRARLDAARGRPDAAGDAVATAQAIAEQGGIVSGLRFVGGARGFLELTGERVDAAIAALEEVEQRLEGSGLEEPVLIPWEPDLVEAYVRRGDCDAAERVLARLERRARACGVGFALAAADRCRGMLHDDFGPPFARALAATGDLPFERARTQLAHGRRLHRARRRAEARDELRAALAGFDALGASPWAGQARNELRAAGGRRRAVRDGLLTPQEQRVAAAVCRGASNREIAAELFVTPKTVAFHLRQIYRKLGVRSRTQLIAKLAEPATEARRVEPRRSP